jgi:hypothetical protein
MKSCSPSPPSHVLLLPGTGTLSHQCSTVYQPVHVKVSVTACLPSLPQVSEMLKTVPQVHYVKGNAVPARYMGSGGIAPCLRWRWVVSFRQQLLYHWGRNPGSHWRGDWVGPRDCLYIAKRKVLPCQLLNLTCSAHSLVSILTLLSQLLKCLRQFFTWN